MIHWRNQ